MKEYLYLLSGEDYRFLDARRKEWGERKEGGRFN